MIQKVLIAEELKPLLLQGESLLNRAGIAVFSAKTTDEVLKIHINEIVDLIVTHRDLPGTSNEAIFDIIWQAEHLRRVRVIMACEDDVFHQERCKRCNAHAILAKPVDPAVLQGKVLQFLNASPRKFYRVVLNVAADGKFMNKPFLCHTENISASGVLIRAEMDLACGDGITCSFFLPDGTKVNAQGTVVRIAKEEKKANGTRYGIKFTHIASDISQKIEAYIRKEEAYMRNQESVIRFSRAH